MVTKIHAVLILGLTLLLAGTLVAQQKPEDIPDAPSATQTLRRRRVQYRHRSRPARALGRRTRASRMHRQWIIPEQG